ncbi:MAG: AI-2E family transporter [Chloroflexi bacterium]|nr:AI-2E family transporter [Chloroflexota bacterium]
MMTRPRVRVALWLAMLGVVLWIAWDARWALFPFVIGALFAYVLTPAVDRIASFASFLPGGTPEKNVISRGFAVLLVYLVILGILIGLGLLVAPVALDQAREFIDSFPEQRVRAQDQINSWLDQYRERVPEDVRDRIDSAIAENADQLGVEIASHTTDSFSVLTTTLGVVFGFLIVPFWLFYALRDRHRFEDNFAAAVPAAVRSDVFNGIRIADALLGRYLRGQIFLGGVVAVLTFIGLTIIDVELTIALAIFAGITELIPIIGPWIGALPALLMAAASGDPEKIIWVALLFVLVQQLENNLLVPRIQSQAVDLHPAIIILLLVAAGAVFGFIGLLVVVPLTALLRELFWYADRRLRGSEPDESLAQSHAARHFDIVPPFDLVPPEQRSGDEPAEGDSAATASSSDQGAAPSPGGPATPS